MLERHLENEFIRTTKSNPFRFFFFITSPQIWSSFFWQVARSVNCLNQVAMLIEAINLLIKRNTGGTGIRGYTATFNHQNQLRRIAGNFEFKDFFFIKDDFLDQFQVYSKAERKVQRIHIYPLPPHMHSLPMISITSQDVASVTGDQPALTHHYHPKSMVQADSWCCMFYGFGQTYNDSTIIISLLQFHVKSFY